MKFRGFRNDDASMTFLPRLRKCLDGCGGLGSHVAACDGADAAFVAGGGSSMMRFLSSAHLVVQDHSTRFPNRARRPTKILWQSIVALDTIETNPTIRHSLSTQTTTTTTTTHQRNSTFQHVVANWNPTRPHVVDGRLLPIVCQSRRFDAMAIVRRRCW